MNLFTEEQQQIINRDLKKGKRFRITAFAGTGKTTILIGYAKQRPEKTFLYLAFNKSMQLQAAKRFPHHVVCKTIHSIAWQSIGNQYQQKIGNLKPYHIFDFLDLPNLIEARYVLDTLMNFIFSSDSKIRDFHVPKISKPKLDYVSLAKRIWKAMIEPTELSIPMEHDAYLKLFQIEKIQLPFDLILLDEAQDSNPVTLAILNHQKSPVVIVGDSHQQLYGFRGAVDAMDFIDADFKADLTQSFRFDNTFADFATGIVSYFKEEQRILTGLGGPSHFGKTGDRFAFLSRTNAGLFDQAVNWHKQFKIHFLGGFDQLKTEQIIQLWKLWYGNSKEVTDLFLKRFNHFSEVADYAKESEDRELSSRIKIVEDYRYELPKLIDSIQSKAVEKPSDADCLFTTVHKAKGLEFKKVKLHDDFINLTTDDHIRNPDFVEPEEVNVLYVAVTRAKHILELNEDLETFRKLIPKPQRDLI